MDLSTTIILYHQLMHIASILTNTLNFSFKIWMPNEFSTCMNENNCKLNSFKIRSFWYSLAKQPPILDFSLCLNSYFHFTSNSSECIPKYIPSSTFSLPPPLPLDYNPAFFSCMHYHKHFPTGFLFLLSITFHFLLTNQSSLFKE